MFIDNIKKGKKGQVTLFIILAIIIVAGILLFFLLRGRLIDDPIPEEFRPIQQQYISCIEESATAGISIMAESGGYIYLPDFEPGSEYSPTSNQLDFLGSAIPYWFYVSGNNIVRDQVPSKREMEEQLEQFIEENMVCDFSRFEAEGFEIDIEDSINVRADIRESEVRINVGKEIVASRDEESVILGEYDAEVRSKLGKFYEEAIEIYQKQKEDAILEEYTADTLYLNAPVSGVELDCSPKVWMKQDVEDELRTALEYNIMSLRASGGYYRGGMGEYFVSEFRTDEAVQFIYSRDWPTKVEIHAEEGQAGEAMIAKPVGNQPGMGILGFCYVPYHFVYDMIHPVLIQLYDEYTGEIFQFPVSVIIQGNMPREPLEGAAYLTEEPEVCRYKNQEVEVYTYDRNLNPVEADISFKCFNERCDIGETVLEEGDGYFRGDFPQCVNGFILADAEGYALQKHQISTNRETSAHIILDKLHEVDIRLVVDGREVTDNAIITFESEEVYEIVAWPEQKKVNLKDGDYNIDVQIYSDSSIRIPGTTRYECVDVPRSGIAGIFGVTEEQCFEIEIPSQTIEHSISGGGKTQQYITETELEKGDVEIQAESLSRPESMEDLQMNFQLLEDKRVYLTFR